VKPNYFVNEAHQLICKILFDHFEKYKHATEQDRHHPGDHGAARRQGRGDQTVLRRRTEHRLRVLPGGLDSREAFLDKIVTFAKAQATKVAVQKTMKAIHKDPEQEETWVGLREIWAEALSVDKNFDPAWTTSKTWTSGTSGCRRRKSTERFTTGFDALDWGLTGGGLSPWRDRGVAGSAGHGQESGTGDGCVANLARGKKVLYLSLEMDQDKIAARFDAQLPTEHQQPDREPGHRERALAEHGPGLRGQAAAGRQAVPGRDVRREHGPGVPRPDVDARVQAGPFDRGLRRRDEGRTRDSDLGEPVPNPARPAWVRVEQQHCTLTALQPNRDAVEAQQSGYIDESKLGDSFNQNRPLDALWTINQTMKEKSACVGRIFVAKHRNGKSRYAFKIASTTTSGTSADVPDQRRNLQASG
jgi:hypothetical protein